MITTEEFITNQAKNRAHAASLLREPLELNGIDIVAGCTEYGIRLTYGIEKLASILNAEITTESEEDGDKWIKGEQRFEYEGTCFYETFLHFKEDAGV